MPDVPGTVNFPATLDTPVSLIETANLAGTTLSGPLNSGDLTIPLAVPSAFPQTGIVTLVDSLSTATKIETIYYTSKSGSNLIVPAGGRGAFGSTAQSWDAGHFVQMRPMAEHHATLRSAIIGLETKLGIGAAIGLDKLAPTTVSRAIVSDGGGLLSPSAVTSTELATLSGVSGNVQTQFTGKMPNASGASSDATNLTFAAGTLRSTNQRVTTGILDANGNPLVSVTPTGSATQGVNITNNIATAAVAVESTAAAVAASTVAGTPLTIRASPATPGNTNAGSAAGGDLNLIGGAANRLTSGNSNGGNITLTGGAGIGTGVQGQVAVVARWLVVPDGGAVTPGLNFTSEGGLGVYRAGTGLFGIAASSALQVVVSSNSLRVPSTSRIGFSSGAANVAADLGITRVAGAVMRIDDGGNNAASFIVGPSTASVGSGGASVVVIGNGSRPGASPVDQIQIFSAATATNKANVYVRNQAGEELRLSGLCGRVSTQFDKTSSVALADVPGLTVDVEAGRVYRLFAELYITSNASGGIKATLSGTATMTSLVADAELKNAAAFVTPGTTRVTALNATFAEVTGAVTKLTITGTLLAATAGTVTVQVAQNASFATATSVLINSIIGLIPVT